MPPVAVYAGPFNVFVPNHEASGRMVVDFARNPNQFALPRYVKYVPVDKMTGLFLKMTVEERGRVLTTSGDEFSWADGAEDTGNGNDGLESFLWSNYLCVRKRYRFNLGEMTVDQASWDVLQQHLQIKVQQAMTMRTLAAYTALTTPGNYASGHTSAVSSISGNTGNFAQSTSARGDIQRSLFTAYEKIMDDTLAGVKGMDDFVFVMGSGLAAEIAETQEIRDYIKGSPDAYAQIRGELSDQNPWKLYGLPTHLYGFPIVIDATRRTTTRKGQTTSRSAVWSTSNACLITRPGGLDGVADAPNFSFCSMFIYDKYDMLTETMYDQPNKRTIGRVVDAFQANVTANQAGYLFTSAG